MTAKEFSQFALGLLSYVLILTLVVGTPIYLTRMNDSKFYNFVQACYTGEQASCVKAANMCSISEDVTKFELLKQSDYLRNRSSK